MEERRSFANQELPGGAPADDPSRAWARDPLYRDPRSKSPTLAGLLSAMPGLGQVYVGYYQRGFVHIAVVASIVAILASSTVSALEPLLGLFLAFFWLYNIVDAVRRAALYNLALRGTSPGVLPEDFEMPGLRGSLLGGAVLIVFGSVLLLHTRFGMSLDWAADWWPVAPILFGAYLVYKAIRGRSQLTSAAGR
jgi:hypothetical protein